MQDRAGGRGHPRYLIDSLLEWNYGNTVYYASVLVLLFIAVDGLIIRGDIFRARWGFVALTIALLPVLAEYFFRIIFPWPMKFLITLALILHMAGGIFEFYFTLYPIYDKIAHLVSSMAIAFLFFVTILIIAGVTGQTYQPPRDRYRHLWCSHAGCISMGIRGTLYRWYVKVHVFCDRR